MVQEIDKTEVQGKWSTNGNDFTEQHAIPISNLSHYRPHIYQHYQGWIFTTHGIPSFLWKHWTHWAYIRVKYDKFIQWRFNRKELVRLERMKTLDYILTETKKNRDFETCPMRMLTQLHTTRWINRPDKDVLLNYYTLLFDSLVSSRDLILTGSGGYKMDPQALNTISAFALEERRHHDNYNNQRGIKWLTLGLIFVGIVQAFFTGYAAWLQNH